MSVLRFNARSFHPITASMVVALALVTGCEQEEDPDVNTELEVIGETTIGACSIIRFTNA